MRNYDYFSSTQNDKDSDMYCLSTKVKRTDQCNLGGRFTLIVGINYAYY